METFRAFIVDKREGRFTSEVGQLSPDDLQDGEVTLRTAYSSVNYKDGLAAAEGGNVALSYPLVPGIDLAGTVVQSKDKRFREGDEVIVTGYGLGVAHYGGYSEYARVPAEWIVPLPRGLTMKEAMALGTAGFTAALSVRRLLDNGLRPDGGTVLVTGATGGVGSLAISILKREGFRVAAGTGKAAEHGYLRALGADDILDRAELAPPDPKPLGKQRFAAAVDPVGGEGLAYVLGAIRYGGSVALSGMTGGSSFPASVFPFILRGVNLLGIDSVYCPMELRRELWERLAGDWKPPGLLDSIGREIALDQLPETLAAILKGQIRGRTIVDLRR